MARTRSLIVLVALVVLATSCSFSFGGETPGEAAVDLIEGEFAEQTGAVFTAASCTEPPTEDVGATFTCTAQYDEQRIDFSGEIDGEASIYVEADNILFDDGLGEVERAAVEQFDAAGIAGTAVECGDDPIVLPASNEFVCDFTADGETFDLTVTLEDLSTGSFDFVVDDAFQSTVPIATAGVELIEGELADSLGITFTDATCESPATSNVDETFACTAQLDGQRIDLVGRVDGPESIFVNATNLLIVEELELFERAIEAELEAATGVNLADTVDCGALPRPIPDDAMFVCDYNVEGDVYDATVTITDQSTGAFGFAIADEPR